MRLLIIELGFGSTRALEIFCDNMATVLGSQSDKVHRDSRQTALRLAFIREAVRLNLVSITHIATTDNVADVFTKQLPGPIHRRLRGLLMGLEYEDKPTLTDKRLSVILDTSNAHGLGGGGGGART